MGRARVDSKARKPLGYAVPESVSGKNAWAEARILNDPSTAPLPSEARMAAAQTDAPKRKAMERETCQCGCRCGNWTTPGQLCYLCNQGCHHVCSRLCGELPAMSYVRGMSTPYIPRRAACGGGGALGEGPWKPARESVVPEAVLKRARS